MISRKASARITSIVACEPEFPPLERIRGRAKTAAFSISRSKKPVRHLDTVLEVGLLRADGSSCHAARLDPETLEVIHRKLFSAATTGKIDVARKAHYALLPLVEALYTADHPGPLKDAMDFVGQPVGPVRSPLQRGRAENLERAKRALQAVEAVVF